ncbi:CTP synthase, partial [Clarias magur]
MRGGRVRNLNRNNKANSTDKDPDHEKLQVLQPGLISRNCMDKNGKRDMMTDLSFIIHVLDSG